MLEAKIEKMDDGKDKELLSLIQEGGKPFMRKADGYAVKMSEDKEIKYKDHSDQELTLKVPEGSYVVVDVDCSYPSIVTAEDFEGKNKLIGDSKPEPKKDDSPKIGMALMEDE